MTDSELLRALRSIDKHNCRVNQIIDRIRASGRPDAEILWRVLLQCASPALAEDVWQHLRQTACY